MTIAPLFELILVIALTAGSFSPLTNNFTLERERATIVNAATELGPAAEKVQTYCDDHQNDCTGATWAGMQTAGILTAVDEAKYAADITIVSVAPKDAFVLRWSNPATAFDAEPLNSYRAAGGLTYGLGAATTGYVCFSPNQSGTYVSAATACT